jgi:hypothetical protein
VDFLADAQKRLLERALAQKRKLMSTRILRKRLSDVDLAQRAEFLHQVRSVCTPDRGLIPLSMLIDSRAGKRHEEGGVRERVNSGVLALSEGERLRESALAGAVL